MPSHSQQTVPQPVASGTASIDGRGITLTHHGAVTGVTGSCHEHTLHGPGGAKAGVLVDCGIFQGDEAAGRGGADEQTQDLTPITFFHQNCFPLSNVCF